MRKSMVNKDLTEQDERDRGRLGTTFQEYQVKRETMISMEGLCTTADWISLGMEGSLVKSRIACIEVLQEQDEFTIEKNLYNNNINNHNNNNNNDCYLSFHRQVAEVE